MAKKAKEENLDLFYLNNKNSNQKSVKSKKSQISKKNNKKDEKKKKNLNQQQETKEEKFDFNQEIVIGLKRIDNENEKNKQKINKNKATKLAKTHKEKKKQERTKKSSYAEQNSNDEIMVKDIYSKQNTSKKQNNQAKITKAKRNIKKEPPKLTQKERIAKQKKKAIFKIIKWTTLIAIIIGGIIYTLLSPIFNITHIHVEGNSKISNDEIISLSKIEIQKNMFQYKTSEIINNIKQNAYIENVKVNRKFPDGMELIVEERKATYMIQIANAYAYMNNQGYILEISDVKQELPILTGIETAQEEIQAGSRICKQDLNKLNDVLKIMESATSNGIYNLITSIDITNSNDYVLKLDSKKKTIYLGDTSNLSTKMLWIIQFNEEEKNTTGEIFLNMNLNSENAKPYFRKKV